MSWQSKRDLRRRFGIVGYVGSNGSGKSLMAVLDTMPTLEAGRQVLSTVRLLDWENPRPCDDPGCDLPGHPDHLAAHPLWVPLRELSQMLDFEGGDILLDEVTGVASSRESMSLPPQIANMLVQLRRRDVVLRWTTPAWSRADLIIRETTQAVVLCRGAMSKTLPGRVWPSHRLIMSRVVSAADATALSAGGQTAGRVSSLARSVIRLEQCPAIQAYDTLDRVLSVPVAEGGRCVVCGGRRSVPGCSCGDDGDSCGTGRGAGPLGVARDPSRAGRPVTALRAVESTSSDLAVRLGKKSEAEGMNPPASA
ncbi:hypothetical protein phiB5_08 [Propionibacterium phage B5]|uniref:Orf8 n=1 Tax=Propionibacterium phage B5 TaxID=189836 RepID=Q8SCH8_9VIRU|nr:hypothetical protein phiB5_08 [Propionibacterium phage B5]AAL91701.1 Orf8 [Propionibacterium phage B5]